MNGLDLAHLDAFAAVIEEGSFDAAARRLHVTPSAVSQRIKALEGRVGQILVRRARPVVPTEAGRVLARLAGQVALLESEALAEMTGEPDGRPASLRIPVAVNADSLATWFLPALTALPQVTFDIHQEDQDHSVKLLRDGAVMAAVTAQPQAVQGCRAEPLGAMRYLAVASPGFYDHHFGDGPPGEALATAPMLVFNRKDALQDRFLRTLAGRRVDPPVTYLPSSVGFVDAAKLGLAWGMVPEQLVAGALQNAELVEIAPGRHVDVPLYWQRWRLDSPVLGALTAAVQQTAAASLRP